MDLLSDLKSVVTVGAPVLASALGSPIAGMVLSLIASKFGVDPAKTSDIIEAIKNDPESTIKLKQIENAHIESLQSLENQAYASEVQDRESARATQVNLQSWVPTVLAIGFLVNYALVQAYIVTHHDVNDIISARFQDVLIMIMSYYFGSSHRVVDGKHN